MSDPYKDAELQAEALLSLVKHPGWLLFEKHLSNLTTQSLSEMTGAKTTEELVKHTHAYLLLLQLKDSPQKTFAVLDAQLQAHKKK